VAASTHWGGNWGYRINCKQRRFAHSLIDVAGVDVVHGHSLHHVKGIEIYKNRPIVRHDIESSSSKDCRIWSGAIDIGEVNDFGAERTDTQRADWSKSLRQFRKSEKSIKE